MVVTLLVNIATYTAMHHNEMLTWTLVASKRVLGT